VAGQLDWVFLDIGGPISSDRHDRCAIRDALRELGARSDSAARSLAELPAAPEALR